MDNTEYTSPATEILKSVRAMLHAIAPQVETCDISILEQIAASCSYLAQDLRLDEDLLLAEIDDYEALNADRLMAQSDAFDHA
jgi:hypothetical protein